MANMSYCRFRNTLIDMNDCIEALKDKNVPCEEKESAKKLLVNVIEFLEDENIIESSAEFIYGTIEDRVDKFFKKCYD